MGHANVPKRYKTEKGFNLGNWVIAQRGNFDTLLSERKARLEAVNGWVWNAVDERWEDGFCHLKGFTDQEGHANAPPDYITVDGYNLGSWIKTQRATKEKMSPERKAQLETLPGWSWVWDVISERWEKGFRYLKEFAESEGHTNVSRDYKTIDGFRLGAWVRKQQMEKDSMSLERKKRLKELPGWSWVWEVNSEKWEKGFRYLKEFAEHAL